MYCIWSRQQTRVFVYLSSVFSQVWRVYCGLWHYCSTKWKEPVHSHRKRECGYFVYSFWSLYWSCIKPFESEVFCTFQFHAVLGKNCQNNRLSSLLGLATSRLRNQESATAFASFGRNISYRSLTPSKDQLKRDVRNKWNLQSHSVEFLVITSRTCQKFSKICSFEFGFVSCKRTVH